MAEKREIEKLMADKLFDVEHSLSMYAVSYCTIPAECIYDKEALKPLMEVVETCHIYLIGLTPIIDLVDAKQESDLLTLMFKVAGKDVSLLFELPEGFDLKAEGDLLYIEDSNGHRSWPDESYIQAKLSEQTSSVNFEVKYIGQAYGKDGSRNAIDRLLKHETLQKISLKGIPEGYRLSLLLLAIQPNSQLFTMMNPFARNTDEGPARIRSGLDKLFNTTEQERITLYEASLIRYFYPEFNKEFKDSFPSTNLKVLQDCYEKDFSGVVAEICIDELPFKLFSGNVIPKNYHIAKHDLHKDDARRMFFGL
ncbi:hypothetical protein [Halomonas rhizosphaerae]|uniref:Uncharacterized protein n=1 Tax=Halomonas rhizosphaerae TaxID=3043296 RepID=A0ABT6UYT6_9GAMM|nr:hypothetical protein [Halomonas rhizosphaerae]MDI5891096.1 hypothetical protein [Halomonas rhizosphaerae]